MLSLLMSKHGFALPTVLVVSLVLLTIGLSTLQVTSSISRSLGDQNWNHLAQEATQAGTSYVASCLKTAPSIGPTTWSTLTPGTNCKGASNGASSYYAQSDSSESPKWRVKFAASPISSPTNGKSRVTVTGTLELLADAGVVTKTYTSGTSVLINVTSGSGLPTTGLKAQKVVVSPYSSGNVTCALTNGQSVYCAGLNTSGQLGCGGTGGDCAGTPTTNQSTPKKFNIGDKKAADVFLGLNHTCVLTTVGELYCAGLNNYGQLGDTTSANNSFPQKFSVSGGTVTSASLGEYNTCVVKTTTPPYAEAYCAGRNDSGQLGNNTTNGGVTSTPAKWDPSGGSANLLIRRIVTNGRTTCAVHAASSYPYGVKCAGLNNYGQLGDGTTGSKSTPAASAYPIVGGSSQQLFADNLSMGDPQYGPTCTFVVNDDMYCTGYGGDGQLGTGSTSSSPNFVRFGPASAPYGDSVRSAVGFYGTSCVVTWWAGQTYCSGYNNNGQLGKGSSGSTSSPVLFSLAGGSWPVADSVSITYANVCVYSSWANLVYCAGQNSSGQIGLGSGNTANQLYAVPYGGGSGLNSKSVATATNYICVTTTSDDAYCSGSNASGQLGNATATTQYSPVKFILP